MIELLPLILFVAIFGLILFGYPVAFTLGGLSVVVGLLVFDVDFFYLLSLRVYGTMQNFVLLAVPLFVFMGMMLERKVVRNNGHDFWKIQRWFGDISYFGGRHACCLNWDCWRHSSHHGSD
jgi:TRAP-type mannitol/chloroaromatic compound transport system permease large subunit